MSQSQGEKRERVGTIPGMNSSRLGLDFGSSIKEDVRHYDTVRAVRMYSACGWLIDEPAGQQHKKHRCLR